MHSTDRHSVLQSHVHAAKNAIERLWMGLWQLYVKAKFNFEVFERSRDVLRRLFSGETMFQEPLNPSCPSFSYNALSLPFCIGKKVLLHV